MGWKENIDWSIGNSTGPDQVNCPDQYLATEPKAMTEGGRAALMRRAIDSAKANNCEYAMRLTLITQCHNAAAQHECCARAHSGLRLLPSRESATDRARLYFCPAFTSPSI